MARRSHRSRGSRSHLDPRAGHRPARVGELIRRILAEAMESADDDRLELVSVTGVDVDGDLDRAVVWFTTLDGDDDPEILEAFEEHSGRFRRAVSDEARLRKTPALQFRPDPSVRSGERIEMLMDDSDRFGSGRPGLSETEPGSSRP